MDEYMSERQLQDLIIEAAELGGWLWFHVARSDLGRASAGFPDLVLVRPPELIMVEVKTAKGKLRPVQKVWLDALAKVDLITVDVVRPPDADGLIARLTGAPPPVETTPPNRFRMEA